MIQLSILIPVLYPRDIQSYGLLIKELDSQYNGLQIEIISEVDSGQLSIGEKRNKLLKKANGEYICFIDADDLVSKDYRVKIMTALESNPDCCSLMGVITWDGEHPEIFEHSIKYKEYKTTENSIVYERYPNHLNVIRASIAKQFKFPETNHGEDTDWATQIFKSGLLKTESYIPGIIYHYQYKRK